MKEFRRCSMSRILLQFFHATNVLFMSPPHTVPCLHGETDQRRIHQSRYSSMRCSIHGWVFALVATERRYPAAGGRTIPVAPVNDRGPREAFVGHPLSEATRGLNKRLGQRKCDLLEGSSRRVSGLLRAKKRSRDSDVEDFR